MFGIRKIRTFLEARFLSRYSKSYSNQDPAASAVAAGIKDEKNAKLKPHEPDYQRSTDGYPEKQPPAQKRP